MRGRLGMLSEVVSGFWTESGFIAAAIRLLIPSILSRQAVKTCDQAVPPPGLFTSS